VDSIRPQEVAASAASAGSAEPNVDLRVPVHRHDRRRVPVLLLLVIAIGGVVGACARYGASLVWPTPSGAFPWTTLTVNTVGCAAIGVLMVTIDELRTVHPLVRLFLGTGVLGGFTTFSTYAVEAERLLAGGRAGMALAYLALTVTSALGAVWGAVVVGRWLIAVWPHTFSGLVTFVVSALPGRRCGDRGGRRW
jgi:CrcB protein